MKQMMLPGWACAMPTKKYPHGRAGTTAGYQAHLKAGEPACEPCSDAQTTETMVKHGGADPDSYARYRQKLSIYRQRLARDRTIPACEKPTWKHPDGRTGTTAGYNAHKDAGQPACELCLKIWTAYSNVRGQQAMDAAARRRAAAAAAAVPACQVPSRRYPDGRTGTTAGYMAHKYVREAACDACLRGHADAMAAKVAAAPDGCLPGALRSKYKMSVDDYRQKLRDQGGKCAICGVDSPTDIRTHRFHVDHDHACCPGSRKTCGKCVRGLLCHACNTALGNFKDSPDLLMSAAAYLLSYQNVLEVADA